MRRPSLRSQLNQIRLWVRQGRTDAWIAHKLDITVEQLEQFKRDHRLEGESEPTSSGVLSFDSGLMDAEFDEEPERDADEEEEEEEEEQGQAEAIADEDEDEDEGEGDDQRDEGGRSRRRRRGRRGGRRRGRSASTSFEGTFEQGEEGYGLWLDPAVADSEAFNEHWAGHRDVTVTVEADAITIRRSGDS